MGTLSRDCRANHLEQIQKFHSEVLFNLSDISTQCSSMVIEVFAYVLSWTSPKLLCLNLQQLGGLKLVKQLAAAALCFTLPLTPVKRTTKLMKGLENKTH